MKKKQEKSKKAGMETQRIHAEIIKDKEGHEKVILDLEEYQELLKRSGQVDQKKVAFDFGKLHGLALKVPPNPHSRFKDEDDLWE